MELLDLLTFYKGDIISYAYLKRSDDNCLRNIDILQNSNSAST